MKIAGQRRSLALRHGLAFSAGVIISFWVLAVALLTLQAYGRTVGWGFQLQEPLFVALLAALLLLFALSLFGVFEMGAFFAAWVGNRKNVSGASKGSLLTSFSSGVLATAVATPCTGPFLGSAIGFAFSLPPLQALCIFTAMGLGMALPYLLLAAYPPLLRFLPKPGAWMEVFKQLMGFMMLATVLWLTWVFGAQTGVMAMSLLLLAFFCLSLASWIYGHGGAPWRPRSMRLLSAVLALLLLLGAGKFIAEAVRLPSQEGTQTVANGDWEPFNPERLERLRQSKTPVFIDFTAKWCLICQANHLVLSTDQVSHYMRQQGIVKMKADWTKGDVTIATWLHKFGRSGVPLYLFFDSEGQSHILPQVLTPQIVMDTLVSPMPSEAL